MNHEGHEAIEVHEEERRELVVQPVFVGLDFFVAFVYEKKARSPWKDGDRAQSGMSCVGLVSDGLARRW